MYSGRAFDIKSLHTFGRRQFEWLWHAVHRREIPEHALRVFDILLPIDAVPKGWSSFVSDDHSPYEFSLALGGSEPEIRMLAEPLPEKAEGGDGAGAGPMTMVRQAACGRRLAETLHREFGADLTRFDAVADLFLPEQGPRGPFAIWFAASFDAAGVPSFKVYLNPNARGAHQAPRLVEEMLLRLGFPRAWSTITRAMPRGPELDELRFVSLDLAAEAHARVKVYGFHRDATLQSLVRAARASPHGDIERMSAFCRTVSGGDGVFHAREPASCFAFVAGKEAAPRSVTTYVPVRSFAGNDVEACQRLTRAMSALGISSAPFHSALECLAPRALDAGSGLVAWAAVRAGTSPRVTVYLAPAAMGDGLPRATSFPTPDPDSPVAAVRHYEHAPITMHPLLQRIAREPLDLRVIALLMLNVRQSITVDFARRLANIVAWVDEDAISWILVKQLNDELGDGDPTRLHKDLFERFMVGLSPWLPSGITDNLLAPGHVFSGIQDELYFERSPYEGLGAALVMEIYGKQFDLFIGAQLRRSDKECLSEPVLEWLTLHEALEVEHVDETMMLANRIPEGTKSRLAARGARELGDAAWAFLDAAYAVCYP